MADVKCLGIEARLEQVRDACDFVVACAETTEMDERAVYHCQMAVDEALTNIIEHGYGFEGEESPIEVCCQRDGDRFVITLMDESPAFNPLEHEAPDPDEPLDSREPGGWGIYFIRRLMNDVTYERVGEKNVLTLVKAIPAGREGEPGTPGEGEPVFPVRRLGDNAAVVAPNGRLDSNSSPDLERLLNMLLEEGQHWLFIDMTDVTYIASSGLKILVSAWRRAQDQNGDILLSGMQPRIIEIFEMVGFDMLFRIFPTLEAALAARSKST